MPRELVAAQTSAQTGPRIVLASANAVVETASVLTDLLAERYGLSATDAAAEIARFQARSLSDNIGPVADGRIILAVPFNPTAPALSADVPLLVGHTLNEGGGLNCFNQTREAWSEADLRAYLSERANPVPGSIVDALRRAYLRAAPVEIAAHATTGLRYSMGTVTQATRKAAQRAAPAYAYTFAWKTDVLDGLPRAFHRSELPFVFFNTDPRTGPEAPTGPGRWRQRSPMRGFGSRGPAIRTTQACPTGRRSTRCAGP